MSQFAIGSLSSLIFAFLLAALAFGALALVLAAVIRAARDVVRARRARRGSLPDDWWTQFEQEFQAYATNSHPAG